MSVLKRTEFGDPILRAKTKRLTVSQIKSAKTQKLIKNMRRTLKDLKLGVGLAAPQVGEEIALSVIAIQPTPHRPEVEPFDLVIINPEITEVFGHRKQLWEGCISAGPGKAGLFAKVPRYKKVEVKFVDETGKSRHETFEGLQAHVLQHEIDHLNGLLFVDRVKDTKTYTTYKEYMKMMKATEKSKGAMIKT